MEQMSILNPAAGANPPTPVQQPPFNPLTPEPPNNPDEEAPIDFMSVPPVLGTDMDDSQWLEAYEYARMLARDIPRNLDKKKWSRLKRWGSQYNSCSILGHPCERFLTYKRTMWEEETLPDVGMQYASDEGYYHEMQVRRDLEDMGFTVSKDGQRYESKIDQISGKIDGLLTHWNNNPMPFRIPYDSKSMAPHIFNRVNTLEDFKLYPWTAKYPAQLVLYMYMMGYQSGLFILKNKSSGRWKGIPMGIDFDLLDELTQKAKRVNEHVAGGTLPDRIEYDEKQCGKCSFKHICQPTVTFKGIDFIIDEDFEADVAERMELEEDHKRFQALDKEIKERIQSAMSEEHKKTGAKIVVGNWQLVNEYKKRENKAQEAKAASTTYYWQTKFAEL